MSVGIGIDLGTTFSATARVNPVSGRPEVLPNAEGERLTPSVVWFGTDPPTVGRDAKAQQRAGAADVASFFKRSMGDPHFAIEFAGRPYTPTDLSAILLGKLRRDAEAALGHPVTDAVVTVPAYFTNAQREATIEAGRRAGLAVRRIINEPTAAALAYGVGRDGEETTLVYDLGGGTFDVTLVRITPAEVTVLATDGDHDLGGKDWDDRLAQFLATRFRDEHHLDPLASADAFGELLVRCEEAKRTLSGRSAVTVAVDHAGVRGKYELTRERFEELTADLLERTARLSEQVLGAAGLRWADLTGVLLVGGSTRMPAVARFVERVSGRPPRAGINPDEAVVLGAAVQAAMDEAARPAAPRLRIAGERKIRDVMSHSLGMVAENPDRTRYINSIIVPKNQPIPCAQSRPFQLRTRPGAGSVLDVYLTQGESDDPTACSLLGRYRFTDIPHAPSGAGVLDVSYSYDANGVVAVSAVDRESGAALPVAVEPVPADMSWLTRPPAAAAGPAHAIAYLAFDLSGSMTGDPLAEAQAAAREFLAKTDLAHCSVGLVAFADEVKTVAAASQDAKALAVAIGELRIGLVGGSNDATPLAHTHALFGDARGPRYIVILTDGVWFCKKRAREEATACRADGVEVVAVGFGAVDEKFLKRIATSDDLGVLSRRGELVETFGTIARAITEHAGHGPIRLKKG